MLERYLRDYKKQHTVLDSTALKQYGKNHLAGLNDYGHIKNKGGFSLIELLVVAGIVGALTAIGVPQLLGARNKARNSACQSMYKSAITELTSRLDNAEYTTDDANAVVQAFLEKHRNERNPWKKEQKAYVKYDASAGNTVEVCQVAVYPKSGGSIEEIVVGQRPYEEARRIFNVRID